MYYCYIGGKFTGRFSDALGYIIEEAIKKLFIYRYEAVVEKDKEVRYNFNVMPTHRFKMLHSY